ncbi:hypothetical protein DFJ74DRAFT_712622 [Hyaloraphidium curvatum]|nr:hypothetical protein DFJ74DRAFT_712622 [Hyaloraphidium curvatum]
MHTRLIIIASTAVLLSALLGAAGSPVETGAASAVFKRSCGECVATSQFWFALLPREFTYPGAPEGHVACVTYSSYRELYRRYAPPQPPAAVLGQPDLQAVITNGATLSSNGERVVAGSFQTPASGRLRVVSVSIIVGMDSAAGPSHTVTGRGFISPIGGGTPSIVGALTTFPLSFTGSGPSVYTLEASPPITLDPSTSYWMGVDFDDTTYAAYFYQGTADPAGLNDSGYSFTGCRVSTNGGSSWSNFGTTFCRVGFQLLAV